jgi:hypothetical protein
MKNTALITLMLVLLVLLWFNSSGTSFYNEKVRYIIVVARYNEDINWITDTNTLIYNKGDILKKVPSQIIVPNVGREAETYLRYIIQNYNRLPDVIIFTQANIADHKGTNDMQHLMKIKDEALQYGKSTPTTQDESSSWKPDWNYEDGKWFLDGHYKDGKHVLFEDWFKTHVSSRYPEKIQVYPNAIFAVKKEYILKNSIEFYKNLISLVNWENNPIEAHFLERSWYYIFSDERIHFEYVTYDNDPGHKNVVNLIKQIELYKYPNSVILGKGQEWKGWYGRFLVYKRYMQSINPDTYVLLTDARDVVINEPYSIFIAKALELYDNRVIISVEPNCCTPDVTGHARSSNIPLYIKNHVGQVYKPFMEKRANGAYAKYLNFGLQFGKAKDFVKLFHMMDLQPSDDDQTIMYKLFFDNPDLVKVDYTETIFSNANSKNIDCDVYEYDNDTKSFKNSKTNSYPSIIQTPGKYWACYDTLLTKTLHEK